MINYLYFILAPLIKSFFIDSFFYINKVIFIKIDQQFILLLKMY
jgi:hypothetical protein